MVRNIYSNLIKIAISIIVYASLIVCFDLLIIGFFIGDMDVVLVIVVIIASMLFLRIVIENILAAIINKCGKKKIEFYEDHIVFKGQTIYLSNASFKYVQFSFVGKRNEFIIPRMEIKLGLDIIKIYISRADFRKLLKMGYKITVSDR